MFDMKKNYPITEVLGSPWLWDQD